MSGDGRIVGYSNDRDLVIECRACGQRAHLFLYMMCGELRANVSCGCPCGRTYCVNGQITNGATLADGGPRVGDG